MSTFFKIFWETMAALDAKCPGFSLEDDINSLARCKELSAGFSAKTDGKIRGAIGALTTLETRGTVARVIVKNRRTRRQIELTS